MSNSAKKSALELLAPRLSRRTLFKPVTPTRDSSIRVAGSQF
jgi:hypothetical protein